MTEFSIWGELTLQMQIQLIKQPFFNAFSVFLTKENKITQVLFCRLTAHFTEICKMLLYCSKLSVLWYTPADDWCAVDVGIQRRSSQMILIRSSPERTH